MVQICWGFEDLSVLLVHCKGGHGFNLGGRESSVSARLLSSPLFCSGISSCPLPSRLLLLSGTWFGWHHCLHYVFRNCCETAALSPWSSCRLNWCWSLILCLMLQRLARWFIFPYGVKGLKNGAREAGEKKIPKFTESAWKLTYYLATEVFVVLITYKEPWFGDTSAFWHGWPYQTVKYVL